MSLKPTEAWRKWGWAQARCSSGVGAGRPPQAEKSDSCFFFFLYFKTSYYWRWLILAYVMEHALSL